MIYISGRMQMLKFNIIKERKRMLLIFLLSVLAVLVNAQNEKKFIRQGNREYEKNRYSESEISYRRAIDKNKSAANAVFNVGDALYKQKKYEDAGKQFFENNNMNEDKEKKSAALYNLGNSNLMAKKIQESIDAYKKSLKLNPDNMEAKYNLACAQDLLRQQQQQQQNKDKQDQNKDQNKNKEDKKDQDQNKDNQDQQKNNQEQKQQNQQQQQNISKEDAERLLKALANDEEKVQEKVKLEKAAKAKVRTLKNW
jgi:Ca-activated chloride channel homolog